MFHFIVDLFRRFRYKKQAKTLAPQASEALKDLRQLMRPDRLFTDEELADYVKRHQSLASKSEELLANIQSKNTVPLSEFYQMYSIVGELRAESNAAYQSLKDMQESLRQFDTAYQDLMKEDAYCAYSDTRNFQDKWEHMGDVGKDFFAFVEKYHYDDIRMDLLKEHHEKLQLLEERRLAHNADFCAAQLDEHKAFFDSALGKYPLDKQQRAAIVKLEDNCLVISSAGSGKTSTIIGKTKYLVEKRHIDPSRILIVTYTRKAANELQERLQMPTLACGTFHSLAYQIVTYANGAKPLICENSLLLKIFNRMLEIDADFLKAINDYIIDLQSLMQCEHDYVDAVTYHAERKKYGIQALFKDMDGNIIFTRSEEEKRICSFLTRIGVDFRYEQRYEIPTLTNEYRQYMPDFTIYYTVDGEDRHLYLEHLAVDEQGNVPRWFADNTRGGYRAANKRYHEGIEWKRKFHQEHGSTLIETTSAEFRDGTVYDKLRERLEAHGVPICLRTDKELHQLLVDRSRKVENNVFNLIQAVISLMKSNEVTFEELAERIEKDHVVLGYADAATQQASPESHTWLQERNLQIVERILKPFYARYVEALEYRGEIDFTDAIMQATTYCREGRWKTYDYILVDEFQDISIDRYKFLQSLRSEYPLTKLFCVGDDWQSIFRFSGSDMALFYHFEDYFGYTEQCKIETTYRFHEPLIGKSSMFIQKNPNQKRKDIHDALSSSDVRTELDFISYLSEENLMEKVTAIVEQIPDDETILLIGRYNEDINSLKTTVYDDHNYIYVNIHNREIPFLSVHSAKGKEADHVLLLNCNEGINGFPSLITDDAILKYLLSSEENYDNAEERRLFYVAITRARKHMYVMYDQKSPSPFINDFQPVVLPGEYLCPLCLDGKVVVKRQSRATNGSLVTDYGCTNHAGNCTYFERIFGEHIHPGIPISSLEEVDELKRKRAESHKS